MKKITLLIFLFFSFNIIGQTSLQKTWSTYFLKNNSSITKTAIDSEQNIIVMGQNSLENSEDLNSYSFFTTFNCYQPIPNGGSAESFIAKFNPQGTLLWATFFGGELYDFSNKIEIDSENNIYLGTFTLSQTNIALENSYLVNVSEFTTSSLGALTKFSSDGNLLWSTYIPGRVQGLKLKNDNEIYIGGYTHNNTNKLSTSGAYLETALYYNAATWDNLANGSYTYLMKFDATGNRIAGTYLDRIYMQSPFMKIDFDTIGNVITSFSTYNPNSVACSPDSHQPNYGGAGDCFIMKMNANLTEKIWATYYGGSAEDTNNSIVVSGNDFYVTGYTKSTSGIATTGAFQENLSGTNYDGFIAKFSNDGIRQWGTYLGGTDRDYLTDLVIHDDKLYVTGRTQSPNLATAGAYQAEYIPTYNGTYLDFSGFFAEFTLDGSRNWSSYNNGAPINSITFSDFDGFYLSGYTPKTTGIATAGSWQPNFILDVTSSSRKYNAFLSRMENLTLNVSENSISEARLFPNPATATITISNETNIKTIEIFNTLGQSMMTKKVNDVASEIVVSNFANGIYFVKIKNQEGEKMVKLIKK